jgi:hypothetical protein
MSVGRVVSMHLTCEVTTETYELGESLPLAVGLSFELLRAP